MTNTSLVDMSQHAWDGTIAQATIEEFKAMPETKKATCRVRYMDMAPPMLEEQKMMDAIPDRPIHLPIPDYARRYFLPG